MAWLSKALSTVLRKVVDDDALGLILLTEKRKYGVRVLE